MNVTLSDGEILPSGVNKLLSFLALQPDDVFIDLGSGKGKLVSQVFLFSKAKIVTGIELRPELHQIAMAEKLRITQEHSDSFSQDRKLNFLCEDFFSTDLSKATVLLINSTCFSLEMLYALGEKINQLNSVHTILTSRPILNLTKLFFKKTLHIECSWDSALCYVYK